MNNYQALKEKLSEQKMTKDTKDNKTTPINYYDTPDERRRHGNKYVEVMSALTGFRK